LKNILVFIKNGNSLQRANMLIVTAAFLHTLMLSEDIPFDYDIEEVIMWEPDKESDTTASSTTNRRRQQILAYLLESR